MSSTPLVRRAVKTDARALAELHVRAWQWAYRDQLPDTFLDSLSATVDRREARRRGVLARPESEQRAWVAEVSGQIVGFADTGPSRDDEAAPDTAELYAIYLDQPVVGAGVGRALMRHATEDLRQRGYRTAMLWVLDSNTRAHRFYEAAGWLLDGSAKTDNVQDVVLRRCATALTYDQVRSRRSTDSGGGVSTCGERSWASMPPSTYTIRPVMWLASYAAMDLHVHAKRLRQVGDLDQRSDAAHVAHPTPPRPRS